MLPGGRLALIALSGLPVVRPKDDLAALIVSALTATGEALAPGDVLVVTSKLVSRAEDRFVDLSRVTPTPEGRAIARQVDKDPRLVTLILQESTHISRKAKGALIVQSRLGAVCANAGIDQSNAAPVDAAPGSGPWVLLLPRAPDASAARLREALFQRTGVRPGVVLSDSFGRPFRTGTVGVALGLAGLPAVLDQRGSLDLFGRPLEHTITALADQIAAAGDLVAGQAAEGRGVVLVRGLELPAEDGVSTDLLRAPETDLYR
ncbi:MAG: coenzyme F420-0:L-glutamate ligase [Polyangiaceae bacterium]|nr:coenzyme F420-0:L-glutamate ligase [Polyangiaceae bacterium]MCW5791339.1 coenzyme F420-0:L-glutamate ligase [Polyangiaceae bacterium]